MLESCEFRPFAEMVAGDASKHNITSYEFLFPGRSPHDVVRSVARPQPTKPGERSQDRAPGECRPEGQ